MRVSTVDVVQFATKDEDDIPCVVENCCNHTRFILSIDKNNFIFCSHHLYNLSMFIKDAIKADCIEPIPSQE